MTAGYLTFGHYVYLGRVKSAVRRNAKRAGLVIVDAKRWNEMWGRASTIGRIQYQGVWYNTVRYNPADPMERAYTATGL